ncbi:MAG: GNAT family N-acetyltransferase, partial [Candidatus Peribacteria bacterium]|nr:GNAT family N-acetyltransferase [Candidatus Peribacteria bacterium]
HIYGELQKIGESSSTATQHSGLGKKLLTFAEEIAKKAGFHQISVISGVGVRVYYAKLGYTLVGTYMLKKL